MKKLLTFLFLMLFSSGMVMSQSVDANTQIKNLGSAVQAKANVNNIGSILNCIQSNTSTTAYTCSTANSVAPIANVTVIQFEALYANTGAATLSFNGAAAYPIVKQGGNYVALVSGDLAANHWIQAKFDGAHWQLEGQLGNGIPVVATSTPLMDGTATAGSTGKWADAGHIHPTDTSRLAATSPAVGTTGAAPLYTNSEYSLGTCTTAATINPTNGNRQKITLTAGDTCALTFTQPTAATASITLKIVQASTGSFNGAISGALWPDSTIPTITQTSAAVDFITCYLDGSNAFCVPVQNFTVSSGSTYSLTLTSANGALSGTGCTAGSSIASGTSVSCTATPNTDYVFSSWTGTGSASSCTTGTCAFSLLAPTTLTANYTYQQAATPTFSPAAGTYSTTQSITASTTTSACSAYLYTGTANLPTTETATASVASSETLYSYVHGCPNYADSAVGSAAYTISVSAAATPTLNVGTGTYNNNQSITISDSTSGATICYTTSGTAPTAPTAGTCGSGSTTYSSAVTISSDSANNLQALATKSGLTNSSVASATYTLTTATPTATPAAGTYSSTQSVTLASTTTGATILYTTNGSTPACPSTGTTYSSAISVSATETINAVSCLTNYNSSSELSAAYTISVASLPVYLAGAGTGPGYGGTTTAFNSAGATLLVAGCESGTSSSPNFSDAYNNTWNTLATYGSSVNGYVTIGYAYAKSGAALVTGASETVTCNNSGGSPVAAAFSNTLTTSSVYDTSSGNATASVSLTPATSGELFVTLSASGDAGGQNDGGPSASGYTVVASFNNGSLNEKNDWGFAYKVNSGSSAVTTTWSYSDDVNISTTVAAFK